MKIQTELAKIQLGVIYLHASMNLMVMRVRSVKDSIAKCRGTK
jgi:uncharacterized membrane protein